MSALTSDGPFVSLAFLCERVLEEKDGVLSFIRMIDTLTHVAPPGQTPLQIPVDATLVVGFRSGASIGERDVRMRIVGIGDSSEVASSQSIPLGFAGGLSGPTIVINLAGSTFVPTPGDYWIEVYLADSLVTKVALRVNLAEAPTPMQPLPKSDGPQG
jgi:hypothetical protein